MTKDITREEAHALRLMARLAFRNSVGATEDDAVKFDHREYSTLDLNFLWHFKMLIEEEEREACAALCEKLGAEEYGSLYIAAAIRARNEK